MSRLNKRELVLNIYYFLFCFILVFILFRFIYKGYSKQSWNITEFLINYEGGFVRRGLLGQIVLNLYHYIGINPYYAILFISITAYIALLWFFIRSFMRQGYTLFILPFVFFMGNPVINNFFVRKDALLIVFFILIIKFALKKGWVNILIVNLSLAIGILIHENLGFITFPVLFLLYKARWKNIEGTLNDSFRACLTIYPAILAFFGVLFNKGTKEIATRIWDSWKSVPFPIQSEDTETIPAAVHGVGWTLKQGLGLTYQTLITFDKFIYAPVAWVIIILLIYILLVNTSQLNIRLLKYVPTKNFNSSFLSKILILQLIAITPIFMLGWDYGRWIFYWVASSFALILLIPPYRLDDLFPPIIKNIEDTASHILSPVVKKSFILPLCLLIGFCPYSWSLVASINTSSIMIVYRFLTAQI